MLTKDLLKFRVRKDRVHPGLLKGSEAELEVANALVALFSKSAGKRRIDIEAGISAIDSALVPAFAKLLWDRTSDEDDSDQIRTFRTDVLQQAQSVRNDFVGSLEMFQRKVAAKLQVEPESLQNRLYQDLAEFRTIASVKHLTAEELIQRYNCAQVQGLLMSARSISIELTGTSIAERRAFFRHLKFHRLLALVDQDPDGDTLVVDLSGPMSLFENAQGYGFRLAQFFPHVLNMSRFILNAETRVKNRDVTLKIDHKTGIQSHYRKSEPYIPEELTKCLGDFQNKFSEKLGVTIEANEDFLHIGKQSYCFPDLKVKSCDQVSYVEFFHRWHHHQLEQRVDSVSESVPLIFAVAANVAKKQMQQLAGVSHFTFREFPTATQLKKAIVSSQVGK